MYESLHVAVKMYINYSLFTFSHLIAMDYAVTVRNCSSQDVQLQCEEHSSLAELSMTGTTCHNMSSMHQPSTRSRIVWTSSDKIWASTA